MVLVSFVAQVGQAHAVEHGSGLLRREAGGAGHLQRICRWLERSASGTCVQKSGKFCSPQPVAYFQAEKTSCSTKATNGMRLSGFRNWCESMYAMLYQDYRGYPGSARARSGNCKPDKNNKNEYTCKNWGKTKFVLKLLNDAGSRIGLRERGETTWCTYVLRPTT